MEAVVDWRKAASQILRALRGKRTQTAFSKRLRYQSNVACDWEAGRRLPTAQETLRACERVRIDVFAAFREFQPACVRALGSPPNFHLHQWLAELAGSTSIKQLAERGGYSRYAVARWLQGKSQPRLHDFLALVEAISGRASDLVHALVAIENVPELKAVHAQRVAHRRVAFDAPWSEAVIRVMETDGYRRSARVGDYIARRLGISQAEQDRVLQALEAAGALVRIGGQYVELDPISVDTSNASVEDVLRLKSHWAAVCLERTRSPRAGDWLGYNVMSASQEDIERIRDILRRAYREIRTLAAASRPSESVAVLNLQFITWPDDIH